MDHIMGGYFLVQGTPRPEGMDPVYVPELVWSMGGCICPKIPGPWVLTWTTDSNSLARRGEYRKKLPWKAKQFHAMQLRFDQWFESGQFGYPNVFLSQEDANAAFGTFFFPLQDLRLFSIALPESYVAEFIERFSGHDNIGENGVCQKLRQLEKHWWATGTPLGYEVLGYDGGDFHSFLCHGLGKVFAEDLGLQLTPEARLADWGQAEQAAQYCRREDANVEPGLWQPWLISETALYR